MIAIIILLVLCAATVIVMVLRAPRGYEDETGFHLGEKK